ncbi:hypothetical protein MKW98_013778 [Papaver atlanticum]|uniref:Uncharacterized protein n=1 Tax=Papaver atlanticum TaxID=357466 RepID=A0AAD4TDG0_9MAGN|nr:hypothetical protein MKW98_013778 [Papaver atlanticum]
MAGWVRTITTPFRKVGTLFNQNHLSRSDKKSQQGGGVYDLNRVLQGEVMACGYDDVQVMWYMMLDKSSSSSS